MASRLFLDRDGTHLSCIDFGGGGHPSLLLHGLAGAATEWSHTGTSLTARLRVVAMDVRGHGHSERHPVDVSAAARVADAAHAIERLGHGPVLVVGQSLGGQTAIQLAAERPELVRGLVVVEAGPAAIDQRTRQEVIAWLRSWPVPFRSRDEAASFFGGGERGRAWASGLERQRAGYGPRFEIEVLDRMLAAAGESSLWSQWQAVDAPMLVLRGEEGELADSEASEMAARRPRARFVEIAGAGHDLHLDQPGRWLEELVRFVSAL